MPQTAREKGCLKYLNMLAKFLDVMGAEYQWFDKDEVAKRLGTDFYFNALYTPGTILINPSETVRGLATVLPKNVHVFENFPVLEVLERDSEELRYMQQCDAPSYCPPEPFRTVGATASLVWEDLHARSEI